MKRYLYTNILEDLPQKIILLTGPRQAGKTTLAKRLNHSIDYFNYDAAEDRLALIEKNWDRKKELIIFDEIHKMKDWKQWIKGIYDTEGIPPYLLITGSARLDVHRKVGDSLAGRYFQYRLYPLDLKEITKNNASNTAIETAFNQLWECSGFPEPFLNGSKTFYRRWRRTHTDIILRQDLINLHSIKDITAIETLVMLLRQRAGSCISYSNLARDIQVDANTIKRWLELLENLYIIFRVTPYSKNIARSLLKEPKFYFYDHAYIENDDGAKLENLVASSLMKELVYIEDVTGHHTALQYLRTKDGKEIDFLVSIANKPHALIEVKTTDDKPSKAFEHFSKFIKDAKKIQLVKTLRREKTMPDGLEIRKLIPWLAHLDFLPNA